MTGSSAQVALFLSLALTLWSGLVWAGTAWAQARFRLPADWRGLWLGALAVSLAPLPLGLAALVLPGTCTLFGWSAPVVVEPTGPLLQLALKQDVSRAAATAPDPILAWSVTLVVLVIGVAAWRLANRVRDALCVGRMVDGARPAPDSLADALLPGGIDRPRLLIVEDLHTAFAWGGRAPAIVLPSALLRALIPDQLRMVVAHEAAHLRHRDPEIQQATGLIEAALWFNPFIRLMNVRMQLAAELACDRAVVGDEPASTRRLYARTYLKALRLQLGLRGAGHETAGEALPRLPAAFSPHHLRSEKMRLNHMLTAFPRPRKGRVVAAGLAVMASVLVLGGSLVHAEVAASAAAGERLRAPLAAQGTITSLYGKRKDPISGKTKIHKGIDLRAPLGTPLPAPADGTVIATRRSDRGYGNMVKIDHGDGLVLVYAQLDRFVVEKGQTVEAGEVFAYVGSSGRSTGPHLHLETFVNDKRVDPESVLDLTGFSRPKPKAP